jgi:acyl dehydratase
MKEYFEDYEIGSTRVSAGRTITETDIVIHAGQTGDFYPHHMDAQWCATQPFKERMLAGEINEVAMSYGYDKVRFIAPVFIGDTITSHSEIVAKRDHPKRAGEGLVDEQVTVKNQKGETVIAFVHVYLVQRRGA